MKKISTYLIIILSLSVIILGFKHYESQSQKKDLQNSIDHAFKSQIYNVIGDLSVKLDDYTYKFVISSVSNAATLAELTSYEEMNDDLDISLQDLFVKLREGKPEDLTTSRIDELREIFHIMIQNTANPDATDRLMQIAN
ncbi:hypothetical protein SY83_09800 [Paenibacillus swuensis]|uniref:Uncharacterized protein n=1 Tax=Paenibacillus swuensis TaxID=1178515 RepID=A0A172TI03_9BACL|nr:hypothetical protein [Paenibacillus swuensis]ANE46524.1 hypothetical protein SY83_09800 [Paenibacillus swuensis]